MPITPNELPARGTRADGRATHERILAAARALFAEGGLDGTSLRAIAATTGVDLATLKYHFGTKDQLFHAVYAEGHAALLHLLGAALAGTVALGGRAQVVGRIRALSGELAAFQIEYDWFGRMFLHRMLSSPRGEHPMDDRLDEVVFEAIDTGLAALSERGMVRSIDARALTMLLATGVPTLLAASRREASWLGPPPFSSATGPARLAALLEEVLLGVLLPDPSGGA